MSFVLIGAGIGRNFGDVDLWLAYGGAAAYVAGAGIWSIASAWDAGGVVRRLLLIWLPALIPVAWQASAVHATRQDDTNALAVMMLMPPVAATCLAGAVATLITLLGPHDTD